MITKKIIAELSGIECEQIICPECGSDKFHVELGHEVNKGVYTNGYFPEALQCDCGYGMSWRVQDRKARVVLSESATKAQIAEWEKEGKV